MSESDLTNFVFEVLDGKITIRPTLKEMVKVLSKNGTAPTEMGLLYEIKKANCLETSGGTVALKPYGDCPNCPVAELCARRLGQLTNIHPPRQVTTPTSSSSGREPFSLSSRRPQPPVHTSQGTTGLTPSEKNGVEKATNLIPSGYTVEEWRAVLEFNKTHPDDDSEPTPSNRGKKGINRHLDDDNMIKQIEAEDERQAFEESNLPMTIIDKAAKQIPDDDWDETSRTAANPGSEDPTTNQRRSFQDQQFINEMINGGYPEDLVRKPSSKWTDEQWKRFADLYNRRIIRPDKAEAKTKAEFKSYISNAELISKINENDPGFTPHVILSTRLEQKKERRPLGKYEGQILLEFIKERDDLSAEFVNHVLSKTESEVISEAVRTGDYSTVHNFLKRMHSLTIEILHCIDFKDNIRLQSEFGLNYDQARRFRIKVESSIIQPFLSPDSAPKAYVDPALDKNLDPDGNLPIESLGHSEEEQIQLIADAAHHKDHTKNSRSYLLPAAIAGIAAPHPDKLSIIDYPETETYNAMRCLDASRTRLGVTSVFATLFSSGFISTLKAAFEADPDKRIQAIETYKKLRLNMSASEAFKAGVPGSFFDPCQKCTTQDCALLLIYEGFRNRLVRVGQYWSFLDAFSDFIQNYTFPLPQINNDNEPTLTGSTQRKRIQPTSQEVTSVRNNFFNLKGAIPNNIILPEETVPNNETILSDEELALLKDSYDIYPRSYPEKDLAEAASWPSAELLSPKAFKDEYTEIIDPDVLAHTKQINSIIDEFKAMTILKQEDVQPYIEAFVNIQGIITSSNLGNTEFRTALAEEVEFYSTLTQIRFENSRILSYANFDVRNADSQKELNGLLLLLEEHYSRIPGIPRSDFLEILGLNLDIESYENYLRKITPGRTGVGKLGGITTTYNPSDILKLYEFYLRKGQTRESIEKYFDSKILASNMATWFTRYGLPLKEYDRNKINPELASRIHNLWLMTDLTVEEITRLLPGLGVPRFIERLIELGLPAKDRSEISKLITPSKLTVEEAMRASIKITRGNMTLAQTCEVLDLGVEPSILRNTLIKFGLPRKQKNGEIVNDSTNSDTFEVFISGSQLKAVRNATSYSLVDINEFRIAEISKLAYNYLKSYYRQMESGIQPTIESLYNELVPNPLTDERGQEKFCTNIWREIESAVGKLRRVGV